MDKQELAYIEARLTILELFVFDTEDKIKTYINSLEKVIKQVELQNSEILLERLQYLLEELRLRLSQFPK